MSRSTKAYIAAVANPFPSTSNPGKDTNMRTLTVIPARLASTRLPNKPLADIAGVPMIVRVWQQATAADCGDVLVAAGDAEIVDAILTAGGEAVKTDPDLPSGSDRVHSALEIADPTHRYSTIINLQGDLPTLDPKLIGRLSSHMRTQSTDISTLAAPIQLEEEKSDPNVTKAVLTFGQDPRTARALYFTRATAPWGDGPLYHHIGIYAYRREALDRFVALPPSALEKREKLEQLRALEDGMQIDVLIVNEAPVGVDTPADLERARREFQPEDQE